MILLNPFFHFVAVFFVFVSFLGNKNFYMFMFEYKSDYSKWKNHGIQKNG
jgi:hypothetical protein